MWGHFWNPEFREETRIQRELDGYLEWLKVGEQLSQLDEYQTDEKPQMSKVPKRITVRETVVGFGLPGYELNEDGEPEYDDFEDDEPVRKSFKPRLNKKYTFEIYRPTLLLKIAHN